MWTFAIVILVVAVYLYFLYTYQATMKNYTALLQHPKYFFMEPKLILLFINLYDLKNYNSKAYFDAVKSCDAFCNTLFLLNIDDSWNGIAKRDFQKNKMQLFKIKSLFQKLTETRLYTLNTLETMFITILPEDMLTEKLKNTIFKINELMLGLTQQEYLKKGLTHTEFTPAPYDKDQETFHFFVN